MQVLPYLFFDGKCDDAVAFYTRVLGAEVKMLMRFKENPDPGMPTDPALAEKVMHAELRIGDSTVFVSDGGCRGPVAFQGFSLTLTVADTARAERLFEALAEGGEVQMPLEKTFFSPSFGMVADRFGVSWMIYVGQ